MLEFLETLFHPTLNYLVSHQKFSFQDYVHRHRLCYEIIDECTLDKKRKGLIWNKLNQIDVRRLSSSFNSIRMIAGLDFFAMYHLTELKLQKVLY
jgi:hypothetical protein